MDKKNNKKKKVTQQILKDINELGIVQWVTIILRNISL